MSKSLKTIQVLAKIGMIISKVMFILSVVCGIACFVALTALLGVQELRLGGTDMIEWFMKESGATIEESYYSCVSGVIVCIAQAILCKFSWRYFTNELSAGTPFTMEGAKEVLRLGILIIVIPCVTLVLQEIVASIMLPGVADVVTEELSELGYGVMFIVCSVFFRYGAELESGEKSEKNAGI